MKLIATLLLTLSTAAAADTAKTPAKTKTAEQMVTDDCTRATKAGKQCVIKFDAHGVDANTPGHDGIRVNVLPDTQKPSLIHIRRDFIEQIVKTAEDL